MKNGIALIKRILLSISLVIGFLFLNTGCEKEKPESPANDPLATSKDIIIPKTTKLVDETSAKVLEKVDSTQLVFSSSTPFLKNVQVGDVLVSGITPQAKYGFLMMILDKKTDGAKIIMNTRPALLTEAIEKGSVSISKDLFLADTVRNGRLTADLISFPFEQKIFEVVRVHGKSAIQPKFDFDITIENFIIEKFKFQTDAQWNNEINLSTNVSPGTQRKIDKRLVLKTVNLKPTIVFIGWFPIVISPQLQLHIGASGTVPTEATVGIKATAKGTLGVIYENKSWKNIGALTPDYTPLNKVKPMFIGDIKGYTGLLLNLNLYNEKLVNTYIDFNLYSLLKVDFLSENAWTFSTGKEANVGITTSFFPSYLQLGNINIYKNEKIILSGGPSQIKISSSDNLESGEVNKEYTFLASRKKIPAKFNYEWDFGDGSPISKVKNDSIHKHRFVKPGDYTIMVTLTDGEFDKQLGQGTVIQKIINQPEKITLLSGNNQSGDPGTKLKDPLKIKVEDVKGMLMEGVKVEWKVKSGGGTLSSAESISTANGIAQVNWTLGTTGTQEVEVIAKKDDGSLVKGAPIRFSASTSSDSLEFYKKAVLGRWKATLYWTGDTKNFYYHVLEPDGKGYADYDDGTKGYTSWVLNSTTINGHRTYRLRIIFFPGTWEYSGVVSHPNKYSFRNERPLTQNSHVLYSICEKL